MPVVATPPRVLDARAIESAERSARVFAAFDALAPGESFVLVTDHVPRCMLPRFQAERPGQFEWSPLQAGPEVWQTEILKRDPRAGTTRAVTECLAWDHDRLEALEQRAFEARAAGDYEEARSIYRAFTHGLRHHIGFEEGVLFPEFEARAGFSPQAGPTAVMRFEHREIESLLARIEAGIGDAAATMDGARAELHRILGEHNLKEERILYPGTDQLLTADQRDELVKRIQAFAG
jgi:uncharacterized protein (DUF2249 family)